MNEDDVVLDYCDVCDCFTNEWIAYETCEEENCPYFTGGQELTTELSES